MYNISIIVNLNENNIYVKQKLDTCMHRSWRSLEQKPSAKKEQAKN